MVRRGRFSQGCSTCRKRKIKCDQGRPSCSQCLKAGWTCPRYGDSADRMFQNHCIEELKSSTHRTGTTNALHHLISSFSGGSAPIFLSKEVKQPIDNIAIDFFLSNFIFRDSGSTLRGFYEYLSDFRSDHTPDKTLSSTLTAIALGAYACYFHDPHALSRSIGLFGHALHLVNNALMSPQEVTKDSTLISVLLFSTFGIVTSTNPQSIIDCSTHSRGAMTIMNLRGRRHFGNRNGLLLFLHTSALILQSSIYNSVRVPVELINLREDAERFLDIEDPAWRLSKIVIKVATFRADVKDGILCDASTIVREALKIDAEFVAFGKMMPTSWEYKPVFISRRSEFVFANTVHIYPDLWVAQIWDNLRTCRLLLQEEIQNQLTKIASSDTVYKSSLSPQDPSLGNSVQLQTSQHIIQHLILDIWATIPQYSGCLPNLLAPVPANGEMLKPINTIFSSGDMTTTDVPLTAGAYFSVWPLLTAGRMSDTTTQREWITQRCRFLGHATGIKQFYILTHLFETWKKTVIN